MSNLCDHIDSYLVADLSNEDLAGFEQHLSSCVACQRIVAEEVSMKVAICDASHASERPSVALRERIRRLTPGVTSKSSTSADSMWHRITAVTIVLGLLLIVCVSLLAPTSTSRFAASRSAEDQSISSEVVEVVRPPTVLLRDGKIGVPVESDDPNVSVLLVYDIMLSSTRGERERSVCEKSVTSRHFTSFNERAVP